MTELTDIFNSPCSQNFLYVIISAVINFFGHAENEKNTGKIEKWSCITEN